MREARRKRKVNKAISRVLTSMEDEKVTMYRQYVDPTIVLPHTKDAQGNPITLTGDNLDADDLVTDGDYVCTDNVSIRAAIPRDKRDFFQVDAYHGYCGPSWQKSVPQAQLENADGDQTAEDNETKMDTGVTGRGQTGEDDIQDDNKIDIRSYKEIEIPFLPAVPLRDPTLSDAGPYGMYAQEFLKFGRIGEKIKITNNYMRFDFFAVRNGVINYDDTTSLPTGIDAEGSNLAFRYAAGGSHQIDKATNSYGYHTIHYGRANAPIEYSLTAPTFAKVRIIVFERDCYEGSPVALDDFLKTKERMVYMMGTEETKLHAHFNRGKKTKRDLVDPLGNNAVDVVNETLAKAKGRIIIDKRMRLPMNRKKSISINPLKGKVLEYNPCDVLRTTRDDNNPNVKLNPMAVDEFATKNLPVNINSTEVMDNLDTRSEYAPINKQYGMFMLFYCQRASVEYNIFQKFEYDK